jgi:hypothetical protein
MKPDRTYPLVELCRPRVRSRTQTIFRYNRPYAMKTCKTILFITLLFTLINCNRQSNESLREQRETTDAFATASVEDVGMRASVLQSLVDSIHAGFYPNRHSLLIFKNNKLILEEYFTGKDEIWGTDIGIVNHSGSVIHDLRSVSKSVVGACIGIAISQGKIKSEDQLVFDFFEDYSQYRNDGREKLTIAHLLTMTSGLQWNEDVPYDNPENSEIQMSNSPDAIGFVLSRKIMDEPGTKWQYNGGTTAVLAEIIQRVSGKNVHEFAKAFLFAPLRITQSEWTFISGTQTPAAASGLRLTSRDMLKFGMLYLYGGKWGDKQLLTKEWVERSLISQAQRPNGAGYGYHFYVYNYNVNGRSLSIPAANGNGDQKIFIDRDNDLVVVTTAGNYNQWNIKKDSHAILERIYAAFK